MSVLVSASQKTDELADMRAAVEEISAWLTMPAAEVDRAFAGQERDRMRAMVRAMNDRSLAGDPEALYCQQLLLSRIYALVLNIPQAPTAEGSVVIYELSRLLENATLAAEDRWLEPGLRDQAPAQGKEYLSLLVPILLSPVGSLREMPPA